RVGPSTLFARIPLLRLPLREPCPVPLPERLLRALIRRLEVARTEEVLGQVALRHVVPLEVVGVLVPGAPAELLGRGGGGVPQVRGDREGSMGHHRLTGLEVA